MSDRISITVGALADPLAEQLDGLGIDPGKLDHIQRDHDAIVRLKVRGLLNQRAAEQATKHLLKEIERAAVAAGGRA